MITIEELATKLMLSQTSTILEYDIQQLQTAVTDLQTDLTTLQNAVAGYHPT
jgi:hypothetical protein